MKFGRFRIREKHVMNLLIDVPLLWSKDKKEILTKIIERLLDLHALNLVVLANVLLHFVILGKVISWKRLQVHKFQNVFWSEK